MRGWIILYGLLGAGSLSALEYGVQSPGLMSLAVVSFLLVTISVLSGAVRGRA